jgi:hypothetical protein
MNIEAVRFVDLLIFLFTLCIFLIWLVVYSSRKVLTEWIVRMAVTRGNKAAADVTLQEARLQHWISFDEEQRLRQALNLPDSPIPPEPVKPFNLKEHLTDLLHFFHIGK